MCQTEIEELKTENAKLQKRNDRLTLQYKRLCAKTIDVQDTTKELVALVETLMKQIDEKGGFK
jgi:FtsZ-binding cell division protein ZapB